MRDNLPPMMNFPRPRQEILRWDRREAYGAAWNRGAPSPSAIGLASPGFLGPDYRTYSTGTPGRDGPASSCELRVSHVCGRYT